MGITFACLGYFFIGLIAARICWQVSTDGMAEHDLKDFEGWMSGLTLFFWSLWVVGLSVALPVMGVVLAITWKPGKK